MAAEEARPPQGRRPLPDPLPAAEAQTACRGEACLALVGRADLSELRWHPLLREWVTIAPWRQDRTYHPADESCPLCPTRPGGPETEVPEDYHIAVFENRFPSYSGEGGGRCEVVCYTSAHSSSLGEQSVEHIRDLVEVWTDRTEALSAV